MDPVVFFSVGRRNCTARPAPAHPYL